MLDSTNQKTTAHPKTTAQKPAQNRVIISVNPKAGKTSPMLRAEALCSHLQQKGYTAEILTDLDEVTQKANESHAIGTLHALVGVGGDGTAATLVNRTNAGTPITLLAAGNANLLARKYRLPACPKKMAETIDTGIVRSFDAGLVRSGGTERFFLVMVSCGFDAHIVNGVHSRREERYKQAHAKGGHVTNLSYIKPMFHSLFKYGFPTMTVECLDAPTADKLTCRWAFVFNVDSYGWQGLHLAPFAKENDGKLDHVLFRGGTVFHGIVYAALAQCFGLHRFLPKAKLGQGTRYRITSEESIPFQLDGDPGSVLPLEIEIVSNRFSFLLPR